MPNIVFKPTGPGVGVDTNSIFFAFFSILSSIGMSSTSLKFAGTTSSTVFTGENLTYLLDSTISIPRPVTGKFDGLVYKSNDITVMTLTDWDIKAKPLFQSAIAGPAAFNAKLFSGDDRISGTSFVDLLFSFAGKDTVFGGGGGDIINAFTGADRLFGGAGDDNIDGSQGNDLLDGGAGNDTLLGQANDDTLRGGGGNDSIIGDSENDVLFGGSGQDYLDGGEGNDRLFGGATGSYETLNGGNGNDYISGADGLQYQYGGDGNDTLVGSIDFDTLIGGAGADDFLFRGTANLTNNPFINDWGNGNDEILLDNDFFTALGASGNLKPAQFRAGTNATDASDRIIYDDSTGQLWYDKDGLGGAGKRLITIAFDFAAGNADLSVGDFRIIN
jgi:Ca2+-binding RTX toxin-like protein